MRAFRFPLKWRFRCYLFTDRSAGAQNVIGRCAVRCNNRALYILGYALAVAFAVLSSAAGSWAATTPENLRAAWRSELRDHSRYLAFSQRARAEGYGEVASLFRAAARAEAIHAQNHAAVLRSLGDWVQPRLDFPEVKSTHENLQSAIAEETREHDVIYPEFLHQAERDDNAAAARTFSLAGTAEAEQAFLFRQALASLNKLKGSVKRTFYVCPVCGYMTEQIAFAKCPSCFSPKQRFEAVS